MMTNNEAPSSMFRPGLLAGKRILVTGGGSGLGREIAEEYLRLGAELHICGRRKGVLDETARELMERHGGCVLTHACDVRQPAAIDAMLDTIWNAQGPLTGLVNNAAGNIIGKTESLSPRGFDAVADIVMNGSFYVTQSCGRRWIEGRRAASVISILVPWVWNGSPYTVPSAMSKAGVHIMTKSLAVEWGKFGIRLNAIAAGAFPTPGAWQRLRPGTAVDGSDDDYGICPMGRAGRMGELRTLAAFLMADGCDYITGACIPIDGATSIASGGNYYHLRTRSDDEWQRVRDASRAFSERDKALRTA
jgi:NAD(P)-dependent dehydrogenase (short-subunit alcohol dehydrogenase family)